MRNSVLTFIAFACGGTGTGLAHYGESRSSSGGYSLEIIDEWGNPLRHFDHGGRTYVLGHRGERYQLRVRNNSSRRIEAVVSVDGRDVIDGKGANWGKRGYLIDAYGEITIDGFRLNLREVAAFRFSDVRDSYAAKMGNAREVGVIGVAVFPERVVPPPRQPYMPYRYRSGDDYYDGDTRGRKAQRKPDRERHDPMDPLIGLGGGGVSGHGGGPSRSQPRAPSPPPSGESRSATSPKAHAADGDLARDTRQEERSGLGTEFGERRASGVYEVEFRRQSSHPAQVLAIRYNDREGLLALGIDVDGYDYRSDENWKRETARPFENMPARFSAPPPGWTY